MPNQRYLIKGQEKCIKGDFSPPNPDLLHHAGCSPKSLQWAVATNCWPANYKVLISIATFISFLIQTPFLRIAASILTFQIYE
jgi:hypothetical protein